MKRIFLLFPILFASNGVLASDIGQITADAILELPFANKSSYQRIMKATCDKEGSFPKNTNCFVTPDGKYLYEYEQGAERTKWYTIAKEERLAHTRERLRREEQQRKDGVRAAKQYKEDAVRCKFWRDQNDSPRRTKILEEEC